MTARAGDFDGGVLFRRLPSVRAAERRLVGQEAAHPERRFQRRKSCLRYPTLAIRPQTLLVRTPVGNRGHRPDELERRLRERLDALGPAPRAELLHVLMLPDLERWG